MELSFLLPVAVKLYKEQIFVLEVLEMSGLEDGLEEIGTCFLLLLESREEHLVHEGFAPGYDVHNLPMKP